MVQLWGGGGGLKNSTAFPCHYVHNYPVFKEIDLMYLSCSREAITYGRVHFTDCHGGWQACLVLVCVIGRVGSWFWDSRCVHVAGLLNVTGCTRCTGCNDR